MSKPRRIFCGGTQSLHVAHGPDDVTLDVAGAHQNVNLRLSDISKAMVKVIPDVLVDLLEIAAYVYSADQAVGRGGPRDSGRRWRRHFQFVVPVRCLGTWASSEAQSALVDLLSFLSDDDYEFEFVQLQHDRDVQLYFENFVPPFDAEEVLLFSGGLDSLAGAVQAAIVEKRRVALVSHRSAPKRVQGVVDLAVKLRQRSSQAVQFIPVWATKSEKIGHEYTQRTRSFLYASLATSVARMLGLDAINFYENGVTSFNLPIADQVVGARATRTTHPQTLQGFAKLASLLLERNFVVNSPFMWKTKCDIVRVIKDNNCADLIRRTVSCSRTVESTKIHTHCGRCSQCIERRFATLAAGLSDTDEPPEMYKTELMTGSRAVGEDRTMIESYLGRAMTLSSVDDSGFFAAYPEATRVLRHVGVPTERAAELILDLHRRHGAELNAAIVEAHRKHAAEFQSGSLPDSCALVLAIPGRYRELAADLRGPTFRLIGNGWEIWFEDEHVFIKDSVGARYLYQLLTNPNRPMHVMDMKIAEAVFEGRIAPLTIDADDGDQGDAQIGRSPSGDGGTVADHGTVKGVRVRIEALDEQIARAKSINDVDTMIDAERERDALLQYLGGAVNLHGRLRPSADDDENARQSVTRALKRTINGQLRSHPALVTHLKAFLKQGEFCTYEPIPPVHWSTE